jgi:hypothetical protein
MHGFRRIDADQPHSFTRLEHDRVTVNHPFDLDELLGIGEPEPGKERKKNRGAKSPQRSPCYRASWCHRMTKGCLELEPSRAYPGSRSRQVGNRI